jgi:hypothetical protein
MKILITNLKKCNIIVVSGALVVQRVRNHPSHFDFLPKHRVRVSACDAQLDGPSRGVGLAAKIKTYSVTKIDSRISL